MTVCIFKSIKDGKIVAKAQVGAELLNNPYISIPLLEPEKDGEKMENIK